MPHLAQTLTTAELDLDPDPARRASPDDVHAAAANALDASQAAALEAANQTARAVTDWQAIAHAAQDGQLHEVWIDAGAALHDYICNHCGSRVAGPDACAACQASPWERLPLPEYVLREATRTGATVHFVSGAAAAALAQGTGAVGTLRY
jgi:hypothetical protein